MIDLATITDDSYDINIRVIYSQTEQQIRNSGGKSFPPEYTEKPSPPNIESKDKRFLIREINGLKFDTKHFAFEFPKIEYNLPVNSNSKYSPDMFSRKFVEINYDIFDDLESGVTQDILVNNLKKFKAKNIAVFKAHNPKYEAASQYQIPYYPVYFKSYGDSGESLITEETLRYNTYMHFGDTRNYLANFTSFSYSYARDGKDVPEINGVKSVFRYESSRFAEPYTYLHFYDYSKNFVTIDYNDKLGIVYEGVNYKEADNKYSVYSMYNTRLNWVHNPLVLDRENDKNELILVEYLIPDYGVEGMIPIPVKMHRLVDSDGLPFITKDIKVDTVLHDDDDHKTDLVHTYAHIDIITKRTMKFEKIETDDYIIDIVHSDMLNNLTDDLLEFYGQMHETTPNGLSTGRIYDVYSAKSFKNDFYFHDFDLTDIGKMILLYPDFITDTARTEPLQAARASLERNDYKSLDQFVYGPIESYNQNRNTYYKAVNYTEEKPRYGSANYNMFIHTKPRYKYATANKITDTNPDYDARIEYNPKFYPSRVEKHILEGHQYGKHDDVITYVDRNFNCGASIIRREIVANITRIEHTIDFAYFAKNDTAVKMILCNIEGRCFYIMFKNSKQLKKNQKINITVKYHESII